MKQATAGETVLLREHGACRWVRVVHAAPARETHGTTVQTITVQDVDQYGRAKPRRVVLGNNARIEWAS